MRPAYSRRSLRSRASRIAPDVCGSPIAVSVIAPSISSDTASTTRNRRACACWIAWTVRDASGRASSASTSARASASVIRIASSARSRLLRARSSSAAACPIAVRKRASAWSERSRAARRLRSSVASSRCRRTSRSFVGPRSAEIMLAAAIAPWMNSKLCRSAFSCRYCRTLPQMIVPHSRASSVVTSATPICVFCWIVSDRTLFAHSRLNERFMTHPVCKLSREGPYSRPVGAIAPRGSTGVPPSRGGNDRGREAGSRVAPDRLAPPSCRHRKNRA